MQLQRFLFGLSCLAILAAPAAPQATAPAGGSAVNLSGEITVVQADSNEIERDASKVVVWLVPLGSYRPARLDAERKHYRLVQRNKRFEPELLVVPVGSVVDFPNLDPWFHNVFSLYRGKRFDLGLYQAGSVRSVSFDRPGPSYLFCNIHPEMTGVVLAVNSDWFAISNKAGHYALADVPAGSYVLHVWYENAALEALQSLQRTVVIDDNSRRLPAISVPVNKQMQTEHKNKYGQDYDPNTLKTDY